MKAYKVTDARTWINNNISIRQGVPTDFRWCADDLVNLYHKHIPCVVLDTLLAPMHVVRGIEVVDVPRLPDLAPIGDIDFSLGLVLPLDGVPETREARAILPDIVAGHLVEFMGAVFPVRVAGAQMLAKLDFEAPLRLALYLE